MAAAAVMPGERRGRGPCAQTVPGKGPSVAFTSARIAVMTEKTVRPGGRDTRQEVVWEDGPPGIGASSGPPHRARGRAVASRRIGRAPWAVKTRSGFTLGGTR